MILKAKFKLNVDDMEIKLSHLKFARFIVTKGIETNKCVVVGEQLHMMHLIGNLACDSMSILESVSEVI